MASRLLPALDRACITLTGGRITITGLFAGLPVVLVTMIGAKSGMPRSLILTPIHDECDPNSFALIGSSFGRKHRPAWYFNLRAHPRVICSFSGRSVEYWAHEASDEEYARYWQRAREIYPGYSLYAQRAGGRQIPIMVLKPV